MRETRRYFFIGPERTGTTWIHEYLVENGNVLLPHGTKETFFFDAFYHKGIHWYNRHFKGTHTVVVEVAPTYFKSHDAPHRIRMHFPDATIICTLRNPLDRSISHFNHMVRYGLCKPVFAEAIKEKTDIINASLYHENIVRWVNVFGNNVIILIYDLLKLNPDYYARQLCRFLGIEFSAPSEILKSTKVNPLTIPRSLILASIGNKIKTLFRQQRMYFVVEIAKYMGLKELFFGKPESVNEKATE